MKPSRTTQPYRQGPRVPTMALQAMRKGRTAGGFNMADIWRDAQKLGRAKGKSTARPARPPRPPR